jgi:NADPH-dependent ferric siderophore reductase
MSSPFVLDVLRTETVAPEIVRVWLGGPNVDAYHDNGFADRYTKLYFAPPGVVYDDPTDLDGIRASRPDDEWPRARTYTIRDWDEEAGELAIDFVLHGDAGIAAGWAAAAGAGDQLTMWGPGGAYRPDPDADWHLVVADDAALPAADAVLRSLPEGATVVGVVELAVPERLGYLDPRFVDDLVLIDRSTGPGLAAAVRSLDLPDGIGDAFVHGELLDVREVRRDLVDRGFPTDRLSLSGYWREGKDEDGFQAEKRELAGRPG